MQPVFSFKLRGAYNTMAELPLEQLKKGVICSSAGYHAQGVALAARKLNCDAIIAMPVTTPKIKWKSVKRLGATVALVGDSYDETQAYAKLKLLKGAWLVRHESCKNSFLASTNGSQLCHHSQTIKIHVI